MTQNDLKGNRDNKVLKPCSVYMDGMGMYTARYTSNSASMEKLPLNIEGGLTADFSSCKNCEFTGTFDVIANKTMCFQ